MITVGYGECPSCHRQTPIRQYVDGHLEWESHPNNQGERCSPDTPPESATAAKEVVHIVVFCGGFDKYIVCRYRFIPMDDGGLIESYTPTTTIFNKADTLAKQLNADTNILPFPDQLPDLLCVVNRWSATGTEGVYDVVEKSCPIAGPNPTGNPIGSYLKSRTLLTKLGFVEACRMANNANACIQAIS